MDKKSFEKYKISKDKPRPKVLFIGNGVFYNHSYEWKNVIKGYLGPELEREKNEGLTNLIDALSAENIPNTIKVLPTDESLKKHKDRIKDIFDEYQYITNDELYNFIKDSNINVIITSNYTYDIERLLDNNFKNVKKESIVKKYACSTSKRKDSGLFIKTFNLIKKCFGDEDRNIQIWHMHGELRNSRSIVLSHDAYGRLISKITNYLSSKNKLNANDDLECNSWIDFLIYADVYFVGFGFDYSELDLWWLINKRSHINNRGKMFFYQLHTPNCDKIKLSFLKSFKIDIETFEYDMNKNIDLNFELFYSNVFNDIKKKCI